MSLNRDRFLNFPTNVYLDLSCVNNSSEDNSCTFSLNKAQEVLSNANEYYLSVAKFSVSTQSLPVLQPQALNDGSNTDINKLIYAITMKWKTYSFTANCVYVPDNQTLVAPTVPNNNSGGYYFLYSYQSMVDIFNTCFINCFGGLQTAVAAGSETLPSTHQPFLVFDPMSYRLQLSADDAAYKNSLDNPIEIYLNNASASMLGGFQTKITQYGEKISIVNVNGNNVLELENYNAVQMYEEYSSSAGWGCVANIMLSSSTIGVRRNIISPTVYLGKQANSNANDNNQQIGVLTDFSAVSSVDYKPTASYQPSFYRLIDLVGNKAVDDITIDVYFSTIYGQQYQLNLKSGGTATIKIAFLKKELFLN